MTDTNHNDLEYHIKRARDRLAFVALIAELNPQFLDPTLISKVGERGWTHPWIHFDSLRNYLLLTCFDLLGQSERYLDFQSWLGAKRCENERATLLSTIEEDDTEIQVATKLHRGYLDLYGSKNSFYRFINEMLPDKVRSDLMVSVRIRRINTEENREIEILESDDEKIKYLYRLRNDYTHGAQISGSPSEGVFENFGGPILIDGEMKMGYVTIRSIPERNERIDISVRNWPKALERTVEAAIDVMSPGNAA